MEIKKLEPAQWRGYGFTARYQTGGCWDIVPVEEGFRMEHHSFGKVEERSFNDTLFGEWLEAPVVYGAFQDGELLGIAEGSPESWNHRWRISNLCIFQEKHRRCGVATALMKKMLEEAAPMRMAALEPPPIPARADRAEMNMSTGKQMPRPVRARSPTPSMCPMYIRSTMLYKRLSI